MSVLASVEELRVDFHSRKGVVRAVDGVSFEIRDQEILGLVGETGCGKTVTARSFLRLLPTPPAEYAGGRVLFRMDGEMVDLLRVPEDQMRAIRGDRIAMIFQDPGKALNPAMPIARQVGEVFLQHRAAELLAEAGLELDSVDPVGRAVLRRALAQRSRVPERVALRLPPLRGRWRRLQVALDERVARALEETRIPNPRKTMASYPHELSGGMKQRVMIAQALACDPDLLIADEPTTALDVTIQARILELIRELQDRRRTAVLYITHDLSLVRRLCDRVTVMYAGRVAESGAAEDIFARPLHPYTRGLLGAIPARAGRGRRLTAIEGSVGHALHAGDACRFHARCPHAGPICAERAPELAVRDVREHAAACFLHDDRVALDPAGRPAAEVGG